MQQRDRMARNRIYGKEWENKEALTHRRASAYTRAYTRVREQQPPEQPKTGLWVLVGQMIFSALALAAIFTLQYVQPGQYRQVGQYYAAVMGTAPVQPAPAPDAVTELLRTPVTGAQLRAWWQQLQEREAVGVFRPVEGLPAMGGQQPTFPRNASTQMVVVSAPAQSPLQQDALITSGYGVRTHPITGQWDFHTGIDLAAAEGTAIHAIYPGRVEETGVSPTYGNYIVVRHSESLSSIYCHCSAICSRVGDAVTTGATIALVGSTGVSTGPHLHLSALVDGCYVDPMYLFT